jgi:hypothetical protein
MSKTNLGNGTKSQQNRELRDDELDAATGGMLYLAAPQNSLSPQVSRDHSSPSQFHVLVGP